MVGKHLRSSGKRYSSFVQSPHGLASRTVLEAQLVGSRPAARHQGRKGRYSATSAEDARLAQGPGVDFFRVGLDVQPTALADDFGHDCDEVLGSMAQKLDSVHLGASAHRGR